MIFLVDTSDRIKPWNFVSISSTLSGVWAAISTPAENAFPAPRRMTTATSLCDSISETTCANSSIMEMSMTFSGGFRNAMRATAPSMSSKTRVSVRPVEVVVIRQMLMADFLTSPMLARGSRAPVFSAIHFFSLLMMSSRSFLSATEGM